MLDLFAQTPPPDLGGWAREAIDLRLVVMASHSNPWLDRPMPIAEEKNVVTIQVSVLIAIGVVIITGVVGAVASPGNTTQIIGFCTLAVVSLLGIFQQMRTALVANERGEETKQAALSAATKVEAVKVALDHHDDKLVDLKKTTDDVHILVNSAMAKQLKLVALLARRIANLPGSTLEDAASADAADKALSDHLANQSLVDNENLKKF